MASFSSVLRLTRWATSNVTAPGTSARGVSLAASTALAPILPAPAVAGVVSAHDAIKCPPVARALGLYTGALLGLKLETTAGHEVPAWLLNPIPVPGHAVLSSRSSRMQMAATVQDLILLNAALWLVARDGDGNITGWVHVPGNLWNEVDGRITTDNGSELADGQFIYFPGAMALPFLTAAADSLRHYADLLTIIQTRGRNPVPLLNITPTEDYEGELPEDYPDGMVPEELGDPIGDAVAAWGKARRSEDGAVAYTPRGIKVEAVGAAASQDAAVAMIQARNAVRIDVANHLNLNAELLDGDNGASDTYTTTLGNRADFAELSLPLFLDPIVERLAMADAADVALRFAPETTPAGTTTPDAPPALVAGGGNQTTTTEE